MRKILKWSLRAALFLLLALAILAVWKKEEISRLLAVNSLFSEDKIVKNFSNMDNLFLTVQMSRGAGPVLPLVQGPQIELPENIQQWVRQRAVTSLLVLKDGQIVFEKYYLGTGPEDLRISWSVAKSFLSALLGIIVAEGGIDSIEDPVVKYAPALAETAYDGARIIDVLQMESGVKFDEDYLDFNSDINRMGRVLALGGSMDKFAAGLNERDADPGLRWQYVSIDTHVIGMVIRGATGRSIPELLEEKVLQPMGVEADPKYITDGYGVAFVLGGLNMCTRDFARLGQMYLDGGKAGNRQVVPEAWVAASTVPSANTAPGTFRYGYQWWLPADSDGTDFFARGIYGQHVYVDRKTGVVVATTAADRGFRDAGVAEQNIAIFRQLAQLPE